MTARIINGLAISQRIREELGKQVAGLKRQGVAPGLPFPQDYRELLALRVTKDE